MAKEAKTETTNADVAPPKKSKKLLVIIIAGLLVVLLAVGGAAAFFLLSKPSAEDGDDEEVATEQEKSGKKKGGKEAPPVYVALETFTVNLVPESGEQFLQIILSVEAEDIATGDRIKTFSPKIRNNVMMLLSGKKASELLTKEGKEKLAGEIRDQMNTVLGADPKNGGPIKEVLFTSFIIQ